MSKLEKLLIERGISKAWLARKINKNYGTLFTWIKNNKTPPYESMLKISEVLNVSINKIFNDEIIARSIINYFKNNNKKTKSV